MTDPRVAHLTPQQFREGKRLRRRVIVEQGRLDRARDGLAYCESGNDPDVTPAEVAEGRAHVTKQAAILDRAQKALLAFAAAAGIHVGGV